MEGGSGRLEEVKRSRKAPSMKNRPDMALAKEERRLKEGVPWGKRLAERLMVTENMGKPPKQLMSENVRAVLANMPPSEENLDLRPFLDTLREEEIWEAVQRCPQVRHLNLSGWKEVALKPLRSISLSVGQNLESFDLSDTPITDEMIEVFEMLLNFKVSLATT